MLKKKKTKRRKKRVRNIGSYTSTKTGRTCTYRSGWELRYFAHLDSDPDVIDWTSEPFGIMYVSNRRTYRVRKYIPDILVVRSSGTTLEEIKPQNRLTKHEVMAKHAAGRQWAEEHNATFVVITEVELKALGLL